MSGVRNLDVELELEDALVRECAGMSLEDEPAGPSASLSAHAVCQEVPARLPDYTVLISV